MSAFGHRIMALSLAAALTTGLSRSATAQMARDSIIQTNDSVLHHARTPIAPPAALADPKPSARAAGSVWIPGFWDFQGNQSTAPHGGWVWVPGRWEPPPERGAYWDEAHWGFNRDWWTWIPGHWDEPKPHK